MASKKDKYLESAQRYIMKGQLDKAIKDYQQIVKLEPKDIRYRQKLAELLVRDNRKDEAIAQYEDIGRHYAENSYYLKAIAVYKQIQRLVPGNLEVAVTLAALSHKQGLTGNAMAEYGQVVAQLEKEGELRQAVRVLDQMLAIDNDHAATRLKRAELQFASGDTDASFSSFCALLRSLQAKGSKVAAQQVSARLAQLFPGREEGHLDLAWGPEPEEEPGEEQGANAPAPPQATAGRETSDRPPGEGNDPGASPIARPAPEMPAADLPGAFDADWSFQAPVETAAPAAPVPSGLPLPWEEEIEIELDVDEDAGETVFSDQVDLSLDFALNLDFGEEDSAESSPAGATPPPSAGPPTSAAPAEPPPPAGATGPDHAPAPQAGGAAYSWDEGPLQLTLPDDSELFEDFEWGGEQTDEPEAVPAVEEADRAPAPQVRGWEEIYPDLEGSAAAEADGEELQSHYDLGIGYKEMGLYNAALKEFAVAAGNPQRRLDCLTLQAVCYREKGEPDKAEELLQRARALTVLSAAEQMVLTYEMAVLFETTGLFEEAIRLYREISEVNPAFHDVARRLTMLSGDEVPIIDLEIEENG